MFPLAHLGISLFIAEILGQSAAISTMNITGNDLTEKKWGGELFDLIPMAFGCLFPDLIDKTVSQILFSSGRALGHTLVICSFCSLALSLFRSRKAGISFFLGSTSHLILDAPGVPFLWPIDPNKFQKTNSALMHLEWIFDPLTLSFELIGFGLLVILGLRYRTEIVARIEEVQLRMILNFQTQN